MIWEIVYSDGYHEYSKFFKMDAYCGDKKIIKILNMLRYCGRIMSDEDYKEFVLPEAFPFEILERNKSAIEVIEI